MAMVGAATSTGLCFPIPLENVFFRKEKLSYVFGREITG